MTLDTRPASPATRSDARPLRLATALRAAVLAGLVAGGAVAAFHLLVTEPVIDRAILLEEQQSRARGERMATPLVSRATQKVGLVVAGLKPEKQEAKEFYVQYPFALKFRGVYVQLVVFLKRLADMKRIIRIGDLEIKPAGPQTAKYVDIEGTLEILTYTYAGSKADEVAKSQGKAGG